MFGHIILLCLYQTSKLAKLFWTIFPAGLLNHFSTYRISLNNALHYIMSSLEYYPPFFPKYSHYQYIIFQNLQIVSPSKDAKIINVLGHYLRKYGMYLFLFVSKLDINRYVCNKNLIWFGSLIKNIVKNEKGRHFHIHKVHIISTKDVCYHTIRGRLRDQVGS